MGRREAILPAASAEGAFSRAERAACRLLVKKHMSHHRKAHAHVQGVLCFATLGLVTSGIFFGCNSGSGGTGGSAGTAGTGGTTTTTTTTTGTGGVPLLDPHTIPKFAERLVLPPAMPPEGEVNGVARYEIAVRQIQQQMLPAGMPATTVWAFGRASDPSTFHTPGFTMETRSQKAVRVKWINGLVDAQGHYLPPLLPVDRTLHWANPAGDPMGGTAGAPAYTGPVPLVTHVHGAHVPTLSDGNPDAWYLPDATDIPDGYTKRGPLFGSLEDAGQGAAVFEYPNDHRADTLWYHDHGLGITRLSVYAGLAGFWVVRDKEEDALGLPGPAPQVGDAPGTRYYELPIAIQDRSFHPDGSLAYPSSRVEWDGYEGPYKPDSPVPPVWNPEVFGNTLVVNGKTWPYIEVEPRLYRLRLLNGCNARMLDLKLDKDIDFHLIGTDGGLVSGAPVTEKEVRLAPGERADVILDFAGLKPGDTLTLRNTGPDEPYQGPLASQSPADPETTGQVMQFRIVEKTGEGTAGAIPSALPAIEPLKTALPPRDLTLDEVVYGHYYVIAQGKLGTPAGGPMDWDAPITEQMKVGDTEVWRLINLTEDAHPIHLHLVMFQVLDRTPFDSENYELAEKDYLANGGTPPKIDDYFTGPAQPAHPWENGWKDTVFANPKEVTRIIATFDMAGRYVWHCHVLEHEDNEMMRPFEVLPLK
jgi:FtsP/CotA-like multicopper oxidase with cupredoxin domain